MCVALALTPEAWITMPGTFTSLAMCSDYRDIVITHAHTLTPEAWITMPGTFTSLAMCSDYRDIVITHAHTLTPEGSLCQAPSPVSDYRDIVTRTCSSLAWVGRALKEDCSINFSLWACALSSYSCYDKITRATFLFASWEPCNAAGGFSIDKGKVWLSR